MICALVCGSGWGPSGLLSAWFAELFFVLGDLGGYVDGDVDGLAASGEWVRPFSQSKKISRGGSGGWSWWMESVVSARVLWLRMASRGSSAVPIPARTIDNTASFSTVRN